MRVGVGGGEEVFAFFDDPFSCRDAGGFEGETCELGVLDERVGERLAGSEEEEQELAYWEAGDRLHVDGRARGGVKPAFQVSQGYVGCRVVFEGIFEEILRVYAG